MSLNAKKMKAAQGSSGMSKQAPIEPGTYPARVAQVLDLGLQPQRPYQGQEKQPKPEIMVTYELVDEFCLGENGEELEDKPRWLSERMPLNPLSSELAKSTKRYYAIDPQEVKEGDFAELVGMPCNVTIIQRESGGKIYDNVGNVSSVRARDVSRMPDLKNEPRVFDMSNPDMEVFGSLPEWIQELMKSNLEFKGSALDAALGGGGKPQSEPEDEGEEQEDKPW